MNRALLLTGGLLNLLFGLLHIQLGWGIQHARGLPDAFVGLAQALNVGVTLLVFFFAYASLFLKDDLMKTALGRVALVVAALLYLSRAAEEFILFPFTPVIFLSCLLAGTIYVVLAARARPA